MKKTLITLAALSFCTVSYAEAATLSNAFYSNSDLSTSSSVDLTSYGKSGDFSVSMTLNAVAVKAIVGSQVEDTNANSPDLSVIFTLQGQGADVATSKVTGLVLGDSTNGDNKEGFFVSHLDVASDGGTTANGNRYAFPDGGLSNLATTDLSKVTNMALTFVFDAGTTYADSTISAYFSYLSEGVETVITSTRGAAAGHMLNGNFGTLAWNNDYVSSISVFGSALSAADAKAINAALIPEPTTATLSLLALAGLAARRRRK